jgi:hypothetical protein
MSDERERIRRAYPTEFSDGAKRAYRRDPHYPPGFQQWPIERRDAWFGGFNLGLCDRRRREEVSNAG